MQAVEFVFAHKLRGDLAQEGVRLGQRGIEIEVGVVLLDQRRAGVHGAQGAVLLALGADAVGIDPGLDLDSAFMGCLDRELGGVVPGINALGAAEHRTPGQEL